MNAPSLSRGHKKRERTRRQLIAAGLAALAEKGSALTISDVVAHAEVSNGTFYNYFADRDELIDALAESSLLALTTEAALETAGEDPARRFAVATAGVLARAQADPTWGRAALRLADASRSFAQEVSRYLREDLADGLAQGRFRFGADPITLDLVTGLLMASLRRIVRGDLEPDHVQRVVERALVVLGLPQDEAGRLAADTRPSDNAP